MTAITYVDLNELEAGQENWLAVIARERAAKKREEHRRRMIADAPARYREYEKKKKRQKFLQLANLKFSPDQPRDDHGRFTSGGSSGSDQQSGSSDKPTGASNSGSGRDGGRVSGASGGVEPTGSAPPVSTEPLKGSPTSAKIRGLGEVPVAPHIPARQAAADYMHRAGLEYHPQTEYVKVDKERATKIANAYEEMKHDPQDPEVKAAYAAMASETLEQYKAILETGLKVEFIEGEDPYKASPRLAIEDVRNNNHLYVFPTSAGFGSDEKFNPEDNPLLAPTEFTISGKPAVVNDIFRAVHDYFGHVKEGNGTRADGEENAWRSHSAMYSPLARRAMTTETRGQNSWVNFGPHGEANKTASGAETHYADQKIGLLPEWVMTEGAKAFEFIQFTKSLETKIARAAVKAAAAAQHTRVEKQAAKEFAKYFQKSVASIVAKLPKSFKPDPDKAKEQAAALIKRAFRASKQNDLLIASMSQPVADAFLEGAYAEMRLSSAAKRRKKGLKFNPNHDETGRFASGSDSGARDEELAGKYLKVTKNDDGTELTMVSRGLGISEDSTPGKIYRKTLDLLGLPGEPAISMYAYGHNGPIKVMAEDESYKATRYVMIDDKEIENNSLEVFKQQGGTGTKILADQVEAASRDGFKKITTYAAKGQYTNGYYTWARLGYDCPINRSGEFTDKVKSYATLHSLKNVSDFMKSGEHRAWWKENGEAFHGSFDLTEGSQSRKALDTYVQSKQAAAGSGKSTGTDRGGGSSSGSNLGQPGQHQSGVKITTATQAARRAEQEIEFATTAPDWLTEAAQDFIIETFQEDYWLRIPETTRDDIELTLYEAIRDGKSIRDIISDIMEAHGDEYSKWRATNVARTEMTGAMNSGAVESMRQAYEGTGLEPAKEWLSVMGTTTRETHADADGQTVPLDAQFTVGGYPCSYPGDITLPPQERCQCQCSIVSAFVGESISDDEEGKAYDPDQPRDENGRFASTGTSGSGSAVVTDEQQRANSEAAGKLRDAVMRDWEKYAAIRQGEAQRLDGYNDWNSHYGKKLESAKHLDKLVSTIKRQQGSVKAQLTKWEKKANEMATLEGDILRNRAEGDHANAARLEAKLVEMAPEVDKAFAAYQKLSAGKIDRMIETVREKIKEKFKDELQIAAPVTLQSYDDEVNKTSGEAISKAESFVKGIITEKIRTRYTSPSIKASDKNWHEGKRAYFSHGQNGESGDMHLPKDGTDYKTVLHELGHSLEQEPEVSAACQAFLWNRTKDEKPFSLAERYPDAGYDAWELGRDDDFRKAFSEREASYVGKFYSHNSTEVLSMGMEKLFWNPREFAEADPEYFKFVVGVLDGSLL